MSTNNCKDCGCKKCACDDKFLSSAAPCPDPEECAEEVQCSEVIDSKCVRYTGDDLTCGDPSNIIVSKDSFTQEALVNIVNLICENTTNKFVKEWVNLETTGAGTPIDITQAEIIENCFGLRNGCFIPNEGLTPLQSKVDFVIDVYSYEIATSKWTKITSEATTVITVDNLSGNITTTLSSGLTYDTIRIVVIG